MSSSTIVTQAKKPGTTSKIKSVSSFMSRWSTTPRAAAVDVTSTNYALSLFVQSLEGTASAQVTGIEACDAIKVINICNDAGVDIFDAKSSNWISGANIRSQLSASGYSTAVLTEIEDWLDLGTSWRAIVPNDPTVQVGSFNDFYGYVAANGPSTHCMTWFGAKGSASTGAQDDADTNGAAQDNARQVDGFGMPAVTASETSRINMLNGRYEYSSTDLVVGNQGGPYELAFVRSYNSALRLALSTVSTGDAGLGFGWTHNWLMKVSENSDGFIPLGEQQVSAAAPAIATLYVMRDVALSDTAMPIENFVIECAATNFLIKQFIKNVVRVQAGGNTLMFLRMPDGTYLPPLGAHGKSTLGIVSIPGQTFYSYVSPEKVIYNYKPTGEISTISYPFGVTISFTYSSGRLSKVSNGFRELNFTYDSFGQLATVNDGNGRTVTLTIPQTGTQKGNLTAVKDPLNNSTTYDYDQRGRLTKVFKPANPTSPIFTNVYDSLSRVMEQRDAYNNLWIFFIAGTRSEEMSPTFTSRVSYFNSKGSVIRNINALGQLGSTQYDGNQRAVLSVYPEGNSVSMAYDADGNLLSMTQYPKPGSPLSPRTTSYTYETAWNKVATVTDPFLNTTTYEYVPSPTNGASLLKKVTGPVVAAGAPITQYTYNSKGQMLAITDPTGVLTSYGYDATNNLVSVTIDPAGKNISTTFAYDAFGNATTTTDPLGNVTSVAYDALRREIQVTGPAPFSQVTTTTYDPNGNVTQVQSLSASDANVQTTLNTFAIDGKVLTTIGPINFADGAQAIPTQFGYDSFRRLSVVIDAQGNEYFKFFDDLSRTTKITLNGVTQNSMTYTTNGSVSTVTDARGKTTTYNLDGFDRFTKATYPDSSFETATYDNRDNVIQATNAAGQSFSFTYDSSNQMVTRTPAGQPTTSFTYDKAGRLLTVSVPVVGGDPGTGTFTALYDSIGRVIGEQYPDGKTVSVVLDNNGRPTKLRYPDGSELTNGFDELDRVISIAGIGGSVSFAYDSASRRVSQFNGNTTAQGYSFDKTDALRAMSIGNLKPSVSVPTEKSVNFAYAHNEMGESILRRVNDPSFNWESGSMLTSTYSPANNINQYPSVDGTAFSYDANGNLTNDGVNTYGYDFESKLISVTTPSTTVQYTYDPFGRLTQKIVGSNKTRYLYASLQRIEEYNNSGTLSKRYVYGVGLDECLYSIDVSSGSISYLHLDERGSPILLTDSTGIPVEKRVFDPWGKIASGSLANVPIGFTGQFFDVDTGLYLYKTRHYSPRLGRFLQQDPIGYAAGLNLYAYCGNNPVNYTDPLGLDPTFKLGASVTADLSSVYGMLTGSFANVTAMNSGGLSWGDAWFLQFYIDMIRRSNEAASAQQAMAQQQAANAAAAAYLAAALYAQAQAQRQAAIRAAVEKYISQGKRVFAALAAGVGLTAAGGTTASAASSSAIPVTAGAVAAAAASRELYPVNYPETKVFNWPPSGNSKSSLNYKGRSYLYVIYTPPFMRPLFGPVFKYGIASQESGSRRLDGQLSYLGLQGRVLQEFDNRIFAKIAETQHILRYRRKYGPLSLPGNLTET